ncbi:MAG: hypothetical protein JRF02_02495 [Deltaproteobacteria bacterium]|nr:hypothetical protein [Deltaproteobacteria bacterium]
MVSTETENQDILHDEVITDRSFIEFNLARHFKLNDDDVEDIIDIIYSPCLTGSKADIAFARKIKSEHLALTFHVFMRWDKRNILENKTGLSLSEAKKSALALSKAITSAEWWIDNMKNINFPKVLGGKEKIRGFSPDGELDSVLKGCFIDDNTG